MLLVTLGASLWGNITTGKMMLKAGYGNKDAKGMLRASYGLSIKANISFSPSFNKVWNTKILSEWT